MRVGWAAALLACACASTDVEPATAPGVSIPSGSDERRMIAWAAQWEAGYGPLDSELTRYVGSVFEPLVPTGLPSALRFRAYVHENALPNAFALPNGCVVVHTGLLARLEDEAQLAWVLAHEIAHVVERHSLESLRVSRRQAVSADIAEILFAPILTMLGSVSMNRTLVDDVMHAAQHGYDRKREKEADLDALAIVSAASWPVDDVPEIFATIAPDADDPALARGKLVPDHPEDEERAAYTRDWLRENPRGPAQRNRAATRYREQTRSVFLANAKDRILQKHYARALRELELALARDPDRAAAIHLARGEAMLKLASDPEAGAAELAATERRPPTPQDRARFETERPATLADARAAFERALELDPRLVAAHRGLGLIALGLGDRATAERELSAYLAGTPNSIDRLEIEARLRELRATGADGQPPGPAPER